jgi:hypothetical protein
MKLESGKQMLGATGESGLVAIVGGVELMRPAAWEQHSVGGVVGLEDAGDEAKRERVETD